MSIHRPARRRPSPALIVACLALFIALGGTSYAVAIGSIGSPQIRDGSIRSIDVKNNGLYGQDLARDSIGGGAIDERELDASQLDAAQIDAAALDASRIGTVARAKVAENVATPDGLALHVLVTGDGGRFHARGVETVDHAGTGRYVVAFDRDVSECIPVATFHGYTHAGVNGEAGTGEIAVRPDGNDPRAIEVQTASSAGLRRDADFFLTVSC